MVFDTDVLIWALRGNANAAKAVNIEDVRTVSVVTYMELLAGARDKREVKSIKRFLADMRFRMLPLAENTGHRASIYMEEYCLPLAMGMADALVAAAAVEAGEPLLTANDRHYRAIQELELKRFRP
jgi:predicted nucleic acid-binding protein